MKIEPIIPFEPVQSREFAKGPKWVSQVKWDGVRMVTYADGTNICLFNRHLRLRSTQFPELVESASYTKETSFVLDGEVVAFHDGKPSFPEVMKRDRLKSAAAVVAAQNTVPVVYMVFDLLFLRGEWITNYPLSERQSALRDIITETNTVKLVQNEPCAHQLFSAVMKLGLEGIVMKDLTSPYLIDGKDDRWRKLKNWKNTVAVIVGMTVRDGKPNAMLLGLYGNDGLVHYIGHVGPGHLSKRHWQAVTEKLLSRRQAHMPIAKRPPDIRADTIWLSPTQTVKVTFLEWNQSRILRQPVLEALVDRDPKSCTFAAADH